MKFFSETEEADILDPTTDADVREAQEVLITATAAKTAAEAEERRLWQTDSIMGVNPPPDSGYWIARRQANEARTAHDQAAQVLARALTAVRSRAQAALDAQLRESWAHFTRDIVPLLRAHAQAMERFQATAGLGGLNFPNVLLSGPPALTTVGLDEWLTFMERNIGL